MPSWWGKSSSKHANKKANKEGIIDAIQRKLKLSSDIKHNRKSAGSRKDRSDTSLEKGFRSQFPSRSPSPPSTQVSCCRSFVKRPYAQPLPLPILGCKISEISVASKPIGQIFLPLSQAVGFPNGIDQTEANGDIATASISYASSVDSDDPLDSCVLSPLASDCENGNRTTTNSPRSLIHKEQSSKVNERNSKISSKPPMLLSNNQIPSTSASPKRGHSQNLLIPRHGAFFSAPDSSMSSPSRSPMRGVVPEQISNAGFCSSKIYPETASAYCSSTGSGYNSARNSIGVDLLGQIFWPQSRCSPECSPIPSPTIASPGPSSRIHSGAVTPLHPRAGGAAADSSNNCPDDRKQQSHRLPLPPITVSNFSPFSTTYSAAVTPSAPRSPGRVENLASPGSRWKKGRLLGRGTFGHVFLGFDSESGEMCAMKEVTLFSDDTKSKESVLQLGQEISVLSRLRHPNIVQYYGCEAVDDKLYIYLEYVSGGSIYKLLQEYGQFGESAIRNYTQQILSGLAYLHAKTTIHRDIKGANILVDPSGRVKLADFGMAKHISGQSCPLSFKGSPYWMAPEVIKNSNGCNLAVDIWSLGCTVLEMATTKPPWSEYEGVAAMFKIGNSKELPAIPDHLSDDGKDFVRLCLQRNPSHRPTAAQLLEHPFVKSASQLERTLGVGEATEASTTVTNPVRSQPGKNISFPESDGIDIYQSRSTKAALSSSGIHTPRNMSCSVSPVGSPLLHSRSPKHVSGRMSPSPISSPLSRSGSSTPLNGATGAIPFHLSEQPIYPYEGTGVMKPCQNNLRTTGGTFYNETKPDFFTGISQTSCVRRDVLTSNNKTVDACRVQPNFKPN